MKTNFKLRILSVFMAISLLIGMAPITAKAFGVHHRVKYQDEKGNEKGIPGVTLTFQGYGGKYANTNADGYSFNKYSYLKHGDVFEFHIPVGFQDKLINPRLSVTDSHEINVTMLPNEDSTIETIKFTYSGENMKTGAGAGYGVSITLTFDEKTSDKATYYLYNLPIEGGMNNDYEWTQVLKNTDGNVKSYSLYSNKWQDGKITDSGILDNLKYNGKSKTEIENEINNIEETKKLLKRYGYRAFKIQRIINRLDVDESIHVDLGMTDKIDANLGEQLCKVNYEIEDNYKKFIGFEDCFSDEIKNYLSIGETVKAGENIELPDILYDIKKEDSKFKKDGKTYQFLGWKMKSVGSGLMNGAATCKIDNDTTFIACFQEVKEDSSVPPTPPQPPVTPPSSEPETPSPSPDPVPPVQPEPQPQVDPAPEPSPHPQPEPQPQPPVQPQPESDVTPPVFIDPFPIDNPVEITDDVTPLATAEETIEPENIPLASEIEEEDIILDDDLDEEVEDVVAEDKVPLSEVPKTKEERMIFRLSMIGFMLAGFMAVLLFAIKFFKREK